MLIYIATFLAFAVVAISKTWKQGENILFAALLSIYLTFLIGYRYQIGVDWFTYEIMFFDNVRAPLIDALGQGDSAYSFINWIVGRAGGQVWHVNLVCAALFSIGLLAFCHLLPRPGIALVVAFPTLIIITAMGYTRQSVAVGCIMLACYHFRGSIDWRWLGWLCLGLLFHKSTLLIFPAFILAGSRNRWVSIIVGGGVAIAATLLVVASGLGDTLSLYLEGDIDSSGALPRILVGVAGGMVFFLTADRTFIFGSRYPLFRNMAVMMIAMLPLYFMIPSRTIIDRIGILLVPFQSMAYAGLSYSLWRRNPIYETAFSAVVILAYGALLGIWLLFATFADYWVPYFNVWFVRWI